MPTDLQHATTSELLDRLADEVAFPSGDGLGRELVKELRVRIDVLQAEVSDLEDELEDVEADLPDPDYDEPCTHCGGVD